MQRRAYIFSTWLLRHRRSVSEFARTSQSFMRTRSLLDLLWRFVYAEKWNSLNLRFNSNHSRQGGDFKVERSEKRFQFRAIQKEFRLLFQCRINSLIPYDVIVTSYLKITGFRHFKIMVLFMRICIIEYFWRWISHPDVRNSSCRQIISRFMELAKGDHPAWNSFGLEFQDSAPEKNYVCPENFLFWNPSNLVKIIKIHRQRKK